MFEDLVVENLEEADRREAKLLPGRVEAYESEMAEATRKEMEQREKRLADELKKIEADQEKALLHTEDVRASDQLNHEEKIVRLNQKAAKDREAIATSLNIQHRVMINELQETCRAVTDDVVRLEKEMNDDKKDDRKVQLEKALFDELNRQKREDAEEKKRREAQLREEAGVMQSAAVNDAKEDRVMANAQLVRITESARDDQRLMAAQGLALLNQRNQAADNTNRGIMNSLLTEIRTLNDESSSFSRRVIGICSSGNLGKATPRRAALTALTRFMEKHKALTEKTTALVALQARLELNGVNKTEEIREIKKKLHDFQTPVAHLEAALRYGNGEMGDGQKECIAQFEKLVAGLTETINLMQSIEERRDVLKTSFMEQAQGTMNQMIGQGSTSPAHLQIEQ